MNINIRKNLLNILLGIVPSSKIRKKLRLRFLSQMSRTPITFNDKSKNKLNNNKFLIINEQGKTLSDYAIEGLNVKFVGKNSSVIVHEPVFMKNCSITVGNNSFVEIFSSPYPIFNLSISATNNSQVLIDEQFSCAGSLIENHDESNLNVSIGKDCMFSHGINMRVSDGHSIYKTHNFEIINKPQNGITIGEHVWIGMNSMILKDVTISSNSIVGAGSLVNKSFNKENVVIAGTPARIVKENINWARENSELFVK